MIQLSSAVEPPFFTFTSAHFKLSSWQRFAAGQNNLAILWLQGFHFWLFLWFFLSSGGSECLSEFPPLAERENGPCSGETANALDRVRELSSIVPIRRARFIILCTRAPSNHSRCSDSSSVGRVGSCCVQVSAAFAKKKRKSVRWVHVPLYGPPCSL